MLLKLIAGLILLVGIGVAGYVVLDGATGLDASHILPASIAFGCLIAFAVLNALADIVDYLEVIASDTKK